MMVARRHALPALLHRVAGCRLTSVRTVIDDGVTRLVTHRASQAAAAQRAGRAARQGPGVAYRLWEEAAHAGRPQFDPPEMLTSDLAPLLLSLAGWGAGDPAAMAWIDPPRETIPVMRFAVE